MKIKFLISGEYEVVNSYDEATDITDTSEVVFKKDEVVEVDLEDDRGDTINVQFFDGSMLYGLPKANFVVVNE